VTALEDGDPAVRTRTGPVGRFLELFSDEFSRASGDASRQPEAIVLPAVEVGAVRVLVGGEVLRTDADPLGLHRRGDHDGAVVEEGAGVQEPGAVALEPVAADEDPFPVMVRVDPGLRVTEPKAMALAMPSPNRTPSARMRRMRSSGRNGDPFTIPRPRSRPSSSGVKAEIGSCWTLWSSRSK